MISFGRFVGFGPPEGAKFLLAGQRIANLTSATLFLNKTNQKPDELLHEKSNVEELRAQRIWQLAQVIWITWAFFAVFLRLRDYSQASAICFVECIVVALTIYGSKGSGIENCRRVMNLCLASSAICLLLISLSHPSLQQTMLFFTVSVLVASQLLGVRASFQWLLVTLVANTVFYLSTCGVAELVARLDELAMIYGVPICVFFCCQQGEEFFDQRTKALVDLSQRLRSKGKTLHKLATTDSLTKLINRHQFQVELGAAVKSAIDNGESVSLLVVDMDGFKEINDTLGHPVGDQALIEIGKRLRDEFSGRASIARLGGDEFCLIFSNLDSPEQGTTFARRAVEVLTERYVFEECDFPLGASIGVAICPDDTESPTELLAFADTAMFVAKENHLGQTSYTPDMTERLVEYRAMQEHLSHALERNEFFLVYQPQICGSTGEVFGVEALLRWRHDGEVIPPFRFIPHLEKSREIIPVGRWIVNEACRQLSEWSKDGLELDMSINVSSVQFNDDDFVSCIVNPVEQFGIDANRLDFEITESLLIQDVRRAVDRLTQIKEIGSTISIDDFGTGYSSLAYLRQFPLDRLKIDRTFVKDIPDSDDGVIASSIVALGKAIGLKVLAEGVETEEQLSFLRSHDCDEYQGFYFSKPIEANEVAKFVAGNRQTTSSRGGAPAERDVMFT